MEQNLLYIGIFKQVETIMRSLFNKSEKLLKLCVHYLVNFAPLFLKVDLKVETIMSSLFNKSEKLYVQYLVNFAPLF